MPDYINERERDDLQEDTGSTLISLHDLRQLYYKGRLGLTTGSYSDTEIIRSFLISQTGLTNAYSTRDLWVAYLVGSGVAYRPSLGDMIKEFFGPVGNAGGGNTANAGVPIGLLLTITYAS